MAYRFNRLLPSLCLVVLLVVHPGAAHAAADLPPLETFIEQVRDGDASALRGIYVPGHFADVIAQQPEDDPGFVSPEANTLTQFSLAARAGSTGLLAHNSLAGKDFFVLTEGQIFYLVSGDGSLSTFRVTGLVHVRALNPDNIRSSFIDLDSGRFLTSARLFDSIYEQPGRVILQTCIEENGDPAWGRLFVIAEPDAENVPAPSLLFEPAALGYASTAYLPI